jgi:hypothetical protein
VPFIDAEGEEQVANYLIPQRNQCQSCHERRDDEGVTSIVPIGPKARNLNRDYDYGVGVGTVNQLTRLADWGCSAGCRTYRHHRRGLRLRAHRGQRRRGPLRRRPHEAARSLPGRQLRPLPQPERVQGVTSQLFLHYENTDLFRLGVCKRPGSAGSGTGGFTFDIVPATPTSPSWCSAWRPKRWGP